MKLDGNPLSPGRKGPEVLGEPGDGMGWVDERVEQSLVPDARPPHY